MALLSLRTGLRYRLNEVQLARKVLSWRLSMLFKVPWVPKFHPPKVIQETSLLRSHSPYEVRLEEICEARLIPETGQVYASRNVILNPVAVPPFLRINLDAVELHRKVDMVATGHSCLAAHAHDLASFYDVA